MKTKEEIEQLANEYSNIGKEAGFTRKEYTLENIAYRKGYTQCKEDMANVDKWTFEEILNACYPTLGRGSDWCDIVKRLREQKLNKQD